MHPYQLQEDTPSISTTACAVYDPRTGDVLHLHEIELTPGAKPVDKWELERAALGIARLKRDVTGLRVVHVPPQMKVDPSRAYKVDQRTMRIIEASEAALMPRLTPRQRRYFDAALGGIVGGLAVALLLRLRKSR